MRVDFGPNIQMAFVVPDLDPGRSHVPSSVGSLSERSTSP